MRMNVGSSVCAFVCEEELGSSVCVFVCLEKFK